MSKNHAQNQNSRTFNEDGDAPVRNKNHESEEVQEDRSAYNCPDCKGEGLLNQTTLCPTCNGTGKV